MEEKIQARMILEILGRPIDYVKEALAGLVEKLGKENSVKIIEKTIHEPLIVQDSKDLYTSFAEVLVELDSLETYLGIMFAYMPSNIEIIYPENLNFKNDYLTIVGNKLLGRLHEYDALAKKLIGERDVAMKKLYEIAPHLFEKKGAKKEEPVEPVKVEKPKKKKSKKN